MRGNLRIVYRNLLITIIIAGILIIPSILAALTSSNQGNIEVNITKIENLDPANANSSLNYTITINMSFDNVTTNVSNLTLIEGYPSQVIFTSSEPAPLAGTNNTFILGNFTFNTSVVVNITVFVNNISNGTVINNTANITYQNSSGEIIFNLSVIEGTTVITQPVRNLSNITVVKNDNPDPANRNGQLNYTIEVNSTGDGPAFNVTVNDTFPAEVVFDSSQPAPLPGTNNTFILGNLTVGTSVLINITVNITANSSLINGTNITNTVTASFQNESSQILQNVTDIEITTVLAPIFNFSNISIDKIDAPDPASAGGQLNYTIPINSTGNGTAYNVTVNETYPPQVIFDSAQPAPVPGTNTTFIIGNLTPGTNFTLNITVNVTFGGIKNGTVIDNNITVTFQNETGVTIQLNTTENTTLLAPIFNLSNLTVNKNDSLDPVQEGTQFTYFINITSSANGTAYNVTVNETYPSQVVFDSAQPAPEPGTGNTFFVVGNLTPGANFSINITVNVTDISQDVLVTNSIEIIFQNETNGTLTIIETEATTLKADTGGAKGASYYGGGGGGGGSSRTTHTMEALTQVFSLRRNDRVQFSLNNVQHSIKVLNILPYQLYQVVLQVGGPQQVRLIKRNSKGIDVNNDGIADLTLTLLSVTPYDVLLRVDLTSAACFESWTCSGWSKCKNDTQTRECVDLRACGTAMLKPKTSQACIIGAEPETGIVGKTVAEAPFKPGPPALATETKPRLTDRIKTRIRSTMTLGTLFYSLAGLVLLILISLAGYWHVKHSKVKRK